MYQYIYVCTNLFYKELFSLITTTQLNVPDKYFFSNTQCVFEIFQFHYLYIKFNHCMNVHGSHGGSSIE